MRAGKLAEFKKNTGTEQAENREKRESQKPQPVQAPAHAGPQHNYPSHPYHGHDGYQQQPHLYSTVDSSAPSSSSPANSSGQTETTEDKCDTLCRGFSALFGVIGEVWFDHNTSIYYNEYPYGAFSENWTTLRPPEKKSRIVEVQKVVENANMGELEEEVYIDGKETIMYLNRKGTYEFKEIPKYRTRQKIRDKTKQPKAEVVTEKKVVTDSVHPPGKRNFVNFEVNGLYSDAETYAFGGAFQTRFAGIIGLVGEYKQFRDQSDKLIFAGFGAELAFVQSGSVSWSFYGQFNGFSGILDLSGFGYGTRLQWFPGGRIGIDLRLGKIEMPDISFWDFQARLGVFIGRAQLFVGYRLIESNLARLQGYETGLQFWF